MIILVASERMNGLSGWTEESMKAAGRPRTEYNELEAGSMEMYDMMDPREFLRLMSKASRQLGYLSGDSCKVLLALALRPESRGSLAALRQVTCIDDTTDLAQAVSDLEDLGLAKYDGKGGIVLHDFDQKRVSRVDGQSGTQN